MSYAYMNVADVSEPYPWKSFNAFYLDFTCMPVIDYDST